MDPKGVAACLFEKGHIPESLYDNLVHSPDISRDKAMKLLTAVRDRVCVDSSYFDTFISILKEQGDWTNDIVRVLLAERHEKVQKVFS